MPEREKHRCRQQGLCECGEGSRRASEPGYCICPACGERQSHEPGSPCRENKCAKCGAAMRRDQ